MKNLIIPFFIPQKVKKKNVNSPVILIYLTIDVFWQINFSPI